VVEYSGVEGICLESWSRPSISSCTIQNNNEEGIFCWSYQAAPLVSDCVIQNNGGYAVSTYGRNVKDYTGTFTITGNNPNAFLVNGDNLGTDTWLDHGVPYVVNGTLWVPNGTTLTLAPGVTLKFAGNHSVNVNGALIADGNAANHITFTSNQGTPVPGDWGNVLLNDVDSASVLDYCDLSYGGTSYGLLSIGSCEDSVTVTNCVVEYSGVEGIWVQDWSWPLISSCTIRHNNEEGIFCWNYQATPLVSDCVIQFNGGYAVTTFGRNVKDYTGTMNITGNNPDAFLVGTDNSTSGTWLNHGVPYIVNGSLWVPNGATLTLAPGDVLGFEASATLTVNGALIADGDPSHHIVFASNQWPPAPGDWGSVLLDDVDAASVLDYCDIRHGGMLYGLLKVKNCEGLVTVTNCVVEQSSTSGIWVEDWSWPSISSCTIQNNVGAGIHTSIASATPVFEGCTIQGNQYGVRCEAGAPTFGSGNRIIDNTNYGFYVTGSCAPAFGDTITEWNDIHGNGSYDFYNGNNDVYAYYVYWGTSDPSVISSRIWDDADNTSLGIVHFIHWLSQDHGSELWTPVITSITEAAGTVQITWDPLVGALSYRMDSSVKPWASYAVDVTGAFAGTTWSAPLNGDIRFYRVNAVAGSEVSAPSNIVGHEQYLTGTP
jgi:parallel beta-helix repeat protein